MTAFGQAPYSRGVERMKTMAMVIILTFGWQAFAHSAADGNIHAALGPVMIKNVPYHHSFDNPNLGGWGLQADADIDQNGGVELTIFYMRQLYSIRRDDMMVTDKAQRMYIATGYRTWFTDRLSGALGFYSSYSMGEPERLHNDFGGAAPETSAEDTVDYGFDISFQYEFLHRDRFSMLVDARYSYSVTPKPQEDENFGSFFIALKYFVQSREEGLKH